MNIRNRITRLEQQAPASPKPLDAMTDAELARLAGFPAGYVPTDAELARVAGVDP